MAFTNFIPKIWSARLLEHLDKAHVYGALANRDYEGEIKQFGDTVHINQIGDVTIKSYTKGTDIDDPEDLSGSDLTLTIDQAKYFNFAIDDIDKVQARPDLMDGATQRAGYALNDTSDAFLANLMAVGAGSVVGSDAEPKVPTADTAYDLLVDLSVALDEANAPKENRWVVVPPFYHGLLLKDKRFIADGTNVGADVRLNGKVGMGAGFTVYESNNVPCTATTTGTGDEAVTTYSKYKIIAGSGLMGASMAEQIVEMVPYKPEKRFSDALKGLHVYGAKVINPKALACLTADRG